jgi:hypothetical protein
MASRPCSPQRHLRSPLQLIADGRAVSSSLASHGASIHTALLPRRPPMVTAMLPSHTGGDPSPSRVGYSADDRASVARKPPMAAALLHRASSARSAARPPRRCPSSVAPSCLLPNAGGPGATQAGVHVVHQAAIVGMWSMWFSKFESMHNNSPVLPR